MSGDRRTGLDRIDAGRSAPGSEQAHARSSADKAQVLKQDSQAERDEGKAADQFGHFAEALADRPTDQHADSGQQKGRDADRSGDDPDIGSNERKADADGGSVDTGPDSRGEQPPRSGPAGRLARFLRVLRCRAEDSWDPLRQHSPPHK